MAIPQRSLIPALLRVLTECDGDALVLNVGERPHMVSSTGDVELGTRPLPLDVVNELMGEVLPDYCDALLDRFGSVTYGVRRGAGAPAGTFTAVATRNAGLEIRRERPAAPAPSARPAKPLPRFPALVLLIDDSQDSLDLYEAVLQDRYQVLQAERGEVGVNVALEQQPDLVVVDLDMPHVSGWEVCRRLASDAKTAWIPRIILTGYDGPHSQVEAARAGAAAFLTKPCSGDRLRHRIDAVIKGAAPDAWGTSA
jgi:CheY-like chemotaxis protein